MSDFCFKKKKKKSKGVYGKRTTYYRNHQFNNEKPVAFYKDEVNYMDADV
jgi:hypothetical protein